VKRTDVSEAEDGLDLWLRQEPPPGRDDDLLPVLLDDPTQVLQRTLLYLAFFAIALNEVRVLATADDGVLLERRNG
jgi:hypothetical protein